MVREATKRAIGRITFAKDEDGQEIVFKDSGRFFGFGDTRADLIVIPVDEYRVIKERIEEMEVQYSMIWRIMIQLSKGQRTSKVDLNYVNEVHREIGLGKF